jgi:hypothetical protein
MLDGEIKSFSKRKKGKRVKQNNEGEEGACYDQTTT